jgi:hypothetical protein
MPTAEQCKAYAAEYQAIGTARDISILRAIPQRLLVHEEGTTHDGLPREDRTTRPAAGSYRAS